MNYHLIPNWNDSVGETYEFKTTIFTSHSGKEQRMADRLLPRRRVSFGALLWDTRLRAFQAFLHDRGNSTITIPDPARYAAVLAENAAAGSTSIVITNVPPWLESGMPIALSDLDQTEFRGGSSLVNVGSYSFDYDDDFDTETQAVLTLTNPLTRSWPQGTVVRPVIEGRLRKEVDLDFRNDSVATVNISLAIDPPSEVPVINTADFVMFEDRPVLLAAPNWTQPPSVNHVTSFDEVDYGRSIIRTYLPIEFYTRITQFNYLGRSRDTIGQLFNMFIAMRGRQGEFYCPSWISDMVASSGIATGSDELTVTGGNFASSYNDSTVNRALAIRLADGRWIFRKVVSIEAVSDAGVGSFDEDFSDDFEGGDGIGSFSRITFDSPINEDIYRRDISMVCWLNVCRFATDTLSIRWSTDDVAQSVAQIMTLEALPPEE